MKHSKVGPADQKGRRARVETVSSQDEPADPIAAAVQAKKAREGTIRAYYASLWV